MLHVFDLSDGGAVMCFVTDAIAHLRHTGDLKVKERRLTWIHKILALHELSSSITPGLITSGNITLLAVHNMPV